MYRAIANRFTLIFNKREESNVTRRRRKQKKIRTISPYLVKWMHFFNALTDQRDSRRAGEIITKGKFIVPTSFFVNSLRFYRAFLG